MFRPLTIYDVLKRHQQSAVAPAVGALICWFTWIVLIILELVYQGSPNLKLNGIYSLAWVFYLGFVTIITAERASIRSHYGINGNPIEDFFASLFVYPCVMVQPETVSEKNGLAPMMPDNKDADNLQLEVIKNDENASTMA